MEAFMSFFEELGALQKFLWIVACITIFWILEGAIPLISLRYKKWQHARVNLVLLGSTMLINTLFGLATAGVFVWVSDYQIGLLHLVDLPLWLDVIIGLLLLDLIAQYSVHYLLHKVKFMWKFHMIHHSDTAVDVTTGTRHHPGDYCFRELFALFAILLGGISLGIYIFYRILTILFTYWEHANIKLHPVLDRVIGYIFITPNMHKFHHHFERPWTDTNFGNIFSIWDRMFGTLVLDDPQRVQYGLDVLEDEKSNDLNYQLTVPFDTSIKTDY